jgi:hypothetical protein
VQKKYIIYIYHQNKSIPKIKKINDDALRHTLDIGKSVEYLLSTGNLISKSGLGLMQVCFYHIFSIEIRR